MTPRNYKIALDCELQPRIQMVDESMPKKKKVDEFDRIGEVPNLSQSNERALHRHCLEHKNHHSDLQEDVITHLSPVFLF